MRGDLCAVAHAFLHSSNSIMCVCVCMCVCLCVHGIVSVQLMIRTACTCILV